MLGDTQAFIVRIWSEELDRAGNIVAWRGSIEHVNHGERRYFDDLDVVVRYIQQTAGISTQRVDPCWKRLLIRICEKRG
ncbi:MAG: hypothetical protein H6632_19585 [Anaerolineales bacterium]|nr:hypothetical protein [Anaerolineales bacterium]